MSIQLNAEFFLKAKKEIANYAKNYDLLNERAKRIEENDRVMQENSEENYAILETFGAIK